MHKPQASAVGGFWGRVRVWSDDSEFDKGLTATLAVNLCLLGVFTMLAELFWFFVMADRGDLHSLPAAIAHGSIIVGWAQLPWLGIAMALIWVRGNTRLAYGLLCGAADTALYTALWYVAASFVNDLLWFSAYAHIGAALSLILALVAAAHPVFLFLFASQAGINIRGMRKGIMVWKQDAAELR